jgi:hypothetical protein
MIHAKHMYSEENKEAWLKNEGRNSELIFNDKYMQEAIN